MDVEIQIDGWWRKYYGSTKYHLYDRLQIISSWQHQVALCGKETNTGNGSFSPYHGNAYYSFCSKCKELIDFKN